MKKSRFTEDQHTTALGSTAAASSARRVSGHWADDESAVVAARKRHRRVQVQARHATTSCPASVGSSVCDGVQWRCRRATTAEGSSSSVKAKFEMSSSLWFLGL